MVMSRGPGVFMRRILAQLESSPDISVTELARALDIDQYTQSFHNLVATLTKLERRGLVKVADEWRPDPWRPSSSILVSMVHLLPAQGTRAARLVL
jgi:predicted ArsR family transcriptional regulator